MYDEQNDEQLKTLTRIRETNSTGSINDGFWFRIFVFKIQRFFCVKIISSSHCCHCTLQLYFLAGF